MGFSDREASEKYGRPEGPRRKNFSFIPPIYYVTAPSYYVGELSYRMSARRVVIHFGC